MIDTSTSGRRRRIADREVVTQRQAVLDDAVGVTVEELDRVDADDRRAGPLFRLAQPGRFLGCHRVDARLTRVTSR